MTISNDSETRKVQEAALNLLIQIQKICNNENIMFYLRGGSVMGAVKYQGFVPWDDDTDIAIPRYDYEKFIKVFSKDFSQFFWLAYFKNGNAIHSYFPRFLLKESYRKKLNLPRNNHLGFTILDVLPLDGVPKNRILRGVFTTRVYFYRLLGAIHTVNVNDTISQHKGVKKRIITTLNSLGIDRWYTQEWTYKKLDEIYTKTPLTKENWCGTITGSSLSKEIFPAKVWGDGIMLDFETTKFRVPKLYDCYLKQIYGENYANEEPEDKKIHFKR